VSTLLTRALRKQADHERVVFVDVNVPPQEGSMLEADWFRKVAAQLRRLEETQRPDNPWPRAFVFFTNHPYHYVGNDVPEPGRSVIFSAVNIPEFKQSNLDLAVRTYPAVSELFDSVLKHTEVPHEL
jgi:hypothetical protein